MMNQNTYPFIPEAGETYRHYKGQDYKIIAIALHADTQEQLVVYQSLKDNRAWVRSLADFTSVLGDKGEGTCYYRFSRIFN